METIAKFEDPFKFPDIIEPTAKAFVPLLKARQAQIDQTERKTHFYGHTERQQLDVYYPTDPANAPILFFAYGGGFTSGSKSIVPGLVYHNIGSFFAQRGILTVIADYRLHPDVNYPSPIEDERDAIRYVLTNKEVLRGADAHRVFLLGHSAGASHMAGLLLADGILEDDTRKKIKGAILNGGAYQNAPLFGKYYDYSEPADAVGRTPQGLLDAMSSEQAKALPPLFFIHAENDLPFIKKWDQDMKDTLRSKGVTNYKEHVMKGHNHISTCFAPGSGEGEEWAEEAAKWINEH